MTSNIDRLAKIMWDYMQLRQTVTKSDVIFALCSLDTRVATCAAQLYLDGLGDYLIFAGGSGKFTKHSFVKPEAEVFADIAIALGVPRQKIILESTSTNTGENIQFTYKLLKAKNLLPRSIILVQKPYMERRAYATFKQQWPDPSTNIAVTSSQSSYEDYWSPEIPKEHLLHVMVGDLQRIKEYPKLGYQIAQDIPDEVWSAYQQLVALGYTKHLIS